MPPVTYTKAYGQKGQDMEEEARVVYKMANGFTKELTATDLEQAIDIARGIYEDNDDCEFAAAMIGEEVVREWGW